MDPDNNREQTNEKKPVEELNTSGGPDTNKEEYKLGESKPIDDINTKGTSSEKIPTVDDLQPDQQLEIDKTDAELGQSSKCESSQDKVEPVDDPEKQQYNMDYSTEEESSNASRSRGSSADSTPIKHLEPPTPTPASQKTKKAPRTADGKKLGCRSNSRFPYRAGIVWRVGAKIEAKDFQEKWYSAKILEVDGSDNTILIHFEGWNSRYDDWFPMTSERLRCITRHSERKETRSKTVNKAEHKIGECVFAKWTDCRMYPGKIVGVASNGSYEVLFYDGFKKNVVAINVKTMPDEVQLEYAKAGLLPEMGKKNKFPIKDYAKEIQERRDPKVKSPESTRRTRCDSDKKSSDKRDRSKDKDPKKEEWEVKHCTTATSGLEKRKRSVDSTQLPLIKKQKLEGKEEHSSKSDKRDNRRDSSQEQNKPEKRESRRDSSLEPKTKKESGRPKAVKNDRSSPPDYTQPAAISKPRLSCSKKGPVLAPISVDVDIEPEGRRSERSTPKTTPKTPLSSPMDTLTTELPTEEYHCPYSACKKTFRKQSLVECHVKYYHTEDGSPVQPPPPRGKRRKTLSVCSDDSELSLTGSRVKGRKKRDRTSLESTVSNLPEVCNEDAMSEDTKTTTTEEYQQELLNPDCEDNLEADEEDDEEDAMIERIEKDEVVNCICQINEENGLMIQCDVCLCWQHALCMEITEETLPTKYVCYVCANPPGVRESGRFTYDQDWIKLGTMQRFSFLSEDRHTAKKARIMEATHSLVGDLLNVKQVLHATKRELSVLDDENSPELNIWKRQLDPDVPEELENPEQIEDVISGEYDKTVIKSEDCKPSSTTNLEDSSLNDSNPTGKLTNCSKQTDNLLHNGEASENSVNSEDSKSNVINDPSKDPETKQETVDIKDTEVKKETDIKTEPGIHKETDSKNDNDIKNIKSICENGEITSTIDNTDENESSKSPEPECPKVEVKQENPFEKFSINLLQHIGVVHQNVEQRLDLLEEQIAALESAEDGKNVDILKDVPKVKKSIHHLINDLSKVKRMSMYH